jgi:hypothetical protein
LYSRGYGRDLNRYMKGTLLLILLPPINNPSFFPWPMASCTIQSTPFAIIYLDWTGFFSLSFTHIKEQCSHQLSVPYLFSLPSILTAKPCYQNVNQHQRLSPKQIRKVVAIIACFTRSIMLQRGVLRVAIDYKRSLSKWMVIKASHPIYLILPTTLLYLHGPPIGHHRAKQKKIFEEQSINNIL